MTDINRLIASIKRRSAHAKEFGDEVTFVKLEDLDALVATIEKSKEESGCPAGVDLQDWVKQLAADNLAMRETIEAVRGAADNSSGIAGWHLNGEIAKWSEILPEIDDIETPATDRIVAEAEARGVEKLAVRRRAAAKVALDEFNDVKNHAELESEAWRAEMFASELREGSDK